MAKLKVIVDDMTKAGQLQIMSQNTWKETLHDTLQALAGLLHDENTVSAYELHSSGLIQALLKMFAIESKTNKKSTKMQRLRVEVFRGVFCHDHDIAAALVKKLIAVLESIEKLPIYLYDNSVNSGYGLQILTRRLRFRLERAPGENGLIDRSGTLVQIS